MNATASARKPDDETLTCASAKAWDAWLAKHHASKTGIWLRIAKAGSGEASVSYAEAIDGALCHGWIDGQKRPPRCRVVAAALHAAIVAQHLCRRSIARRCDG